MESKLVEAVKNLEKLAPLAQQAAQAKIDFNRFLGDFTQNAEVFFQETKPDTTTRLSLPLNFRPNPETGGSILLQMLEADKPEGAFATRVIQVTDLSITYKLGEKNLLLWVTSLETGKPVPDVEIMIFQRDDSRLFIGKTGPDGLIAAKNGLSYPAIIRKNKEFEFNQATLDLASALLAVGATKDDSSFIDLETNRFRPYRVLQAKANEVELKHRNAHVFTERGVYKPGETVFWKATLRKYENNNILPPASETVTVKIENSKGDEIFNEDFVLNEFGTCSGSLKLKDFAPLGQYNVKLYGEKINNETENGSEDEGDDSKHSLLSTVGFQVQKFEKPRHFVEINFEKKSREDNSIIGRKFSQDYLECRIVGKYYTGGPVKLAKVRWTAHLVPTTATIKGFESFHFGGTGTEKNLIESGEGITDKDGVICIQIPIDKSLSCGLFGIEISATILDVDARPATTVSTFETPPKFRVGISAISGKIAEGDNVPITVVILDEKGERIQTGNVQLEILNKRYFYTQKRNEMGDVFYRWESGWMKTISGEQPIKDGRATFEIAFHEGSQYRIQAVYSTPEGDFFSQTSIEVGYVDFSDDEGEKHPGRSRREIVLYSSTLEAAIGENVKVDFTLPRKASHALVTCERDDIYEYRVIPLDGKHGSFETTMKAECRPNTFLTVTIPCGRTSFPTYKSQVDANLPTVFHGTLGIKVKNTIQSLDVQIQPQEGKLTGKPGESKTLEISAKDKDGKPVVCEMAVCVVDEAVLALTGYVTPVLTKLNDFSLPLSIFSGDMRLSLVSQELYKIFGVNALTGGGMGNGALASDLALRKDFRPVAYWNPALVTDQNGKATFSFTLPDSTTAYRIYAVAQDKGSGFCSTERQMVVTKEFYLQPSLPRFLTAGDKAKFPLSVKNKTESPGQANLQVAEAKNLTARILETSPNIPAMNDAVVNVDLEADNGAGEGSLTFSGRMGGFNDAIQLPITILPRFISINRAMLGHFKEKAEIKVEYPPEVKQVSEKDRKETMRATLGLSLTEWTKIVPALRYLLQYPYGCIEQTSSGIIPLAGLRQLIVDGFIPGISTSEVDKFLQPGINRLLGMQTSDGGFGYWPGDREPTYWGTLYGTFALTLAKEAGCDVPSEALTEAITYIQKNLFDTHKGANYHRYGIDELAAIDLALNKKLTKENLNVLMKDFAEIDSEGQAYLLWADGIINSTPLNKLKENLKSLTIKKDTHEFSYYHSYNRTVAAALLATLHIDPNSKRTEEFAGQLLASLKPDGKWHSTADTGMCLFALSKYFKKNDLTKSSPVKIKIFQSGKTPLEVTLGTKGEEVPLDSEVLLNEGKIALEAENNQIIHWTLNYSYPDTASRAEDLDKGFILRKTITNLNGSDEIRVGDILKITLEFEDKLRQEGEYGNYEYLALEDSLPAGLTAINSALKTEGRPSGEEEESADNDEEWYADWEDGAYKMSPNHFEIHDEKVLAFKNLMWSGKFRFSYFARAVCEGSFWMRPSRIGLMYDPETFGLTRGEEVKILPAK